MIFGLFDDWNTKVVNRFRKIYPFIDDLYVSTTLAKLEVSQLRRKLDISSTGAKHRQLVAFYLGVIEGYIRTYLDMKEMTEEALFNLVFSVALFTAAIDKEINNDGEWGALASDYHQVLFNNENIWYRRQGIGYAGTFGDEPEAMMAELIGKLSESGAKQIQQTKAMKRRQTKAKKRRRSS